MMKKIEVMLIFNTCIVALFIEFSDLNVSGHLNIRQNSK